ncbi:hypothetical protein COJ97_25955, partial [Bacillus cereus]
PTMTPPKIQLTWTSCIHYISNIFGLSTILYEFFGLLFISIKTKTKPLKKLMQKYSKQSTI